MASSAPGDPRPAAENALSSHEVWLRLALEVSNDGRWTWDAVNHVATWDARFHELYEFAANSTPSLEAWAARIHPDDRARVLVRLDRIRGTRGEQRWDDEFRSVSPAGGIRWHHSLVEAHRDAAGALVRLTGIDFDVLPNRALFHDRLAQALAMIGRGMKGAVLFVDLDRFKPVNDLHGHQIGDHVLREVAVRLTSLVRGDDTVSRQGGDEFML